MTASTWSTTCFYLLAGKDLGVGTRLLHPVGVVRPAGRERRVPGLLKDAGPAVPTTGKQPKAVHEHDGGPARGVDLFDLR